jgi:hypothetical protein
MNRRFHIIYRLWIIESVVRNFTGSGKYAQNCYKKALLKSAKQATASNHRTGF